MLRTTLLFGTFAMGLTAAHSASASCHIRNETNYSFTVDSGNYSGQSVGAHTSGSIQHGKIIGKSSSGKSFGGFCNNGDKVKVVEERGAVMLMPE
jgi:hypothetical protein